MSSAGGREPSASASGAEGGAGPSDRRDLAPGLRPTPTPGLAPSSAPPAGLLLRPPDPGVAVEVKVPAEPLSTPVGKTAELTCSYSTSVGDSFALEWSFVPPGKPLSASHPVS